MINDNKILITISNNKVGAEKEIFYEQSQRRKRKYFFAMTTQTLSEATTLRLVRVQPIIHATSSRTPSDC